MAGTYHKITSEDQKILEEFPGLGKEDLEAVDRLHEAFLLYEDDGRGKHWTRRAWTTCCHRTVTVHDQARAEGPEQLTIRWASHNDWMRCPFCGRDMTSKNRKRIRNWNGYAAYEPVVFIHVSEDGQTVWAQGYWTTKDLESDPAGHVFYAVTRVYRFRPGEVRMWEVSDWDDSMRKVTDYWPREPFSKEGFGGIADYHVIGGQRLAGSFLRYTMYDVPFRHEGRDAAMREKRCDLMRYLGAAARYPRQVEMLRKAGIEDAVWDLVRRGKKNKAALNWEEHDPRKAFGLNGQEWKAFLQTGKKVYTVALYKFFRKQGKRVDMAEAAAYGEGLDEQIMKKIKAEARQWNVEPLRLLRYLRRQAAGGEHRTIYGAWQTWEGYIQAANGMEYPLWRENVLLPRDLWAAHETATAADRERLRLLREKELQEKEKREAADYAVRRKALEQRYAAELEAFVIRVPAGRSEIVEEGLALKHCVGGYADRHIKGRTTILFMRRAAEPDVPFLTIEMDGEKLAQIHGYKNEGLYTSKGRFAPDPREVYKDVLDRWLAWVRHGSRRDKQGRPLLPKQKKEEKSA